MAVTLRRGPGIRCEGCRSYLDAKHNIVRITDKTGSPVQDSDSRLQSDQLLFNTRSQRYLPYENVFKVKQYVEVQTTAGVFKAFEIEHRQRLVHVAEGSWIQSQDLEATFWWSAEAKNFVRWEGTYGYLDRKPWELESCSLG